MGNQQTRELGVEILLSNYLKKNLSGMLRRSASLAIPHLRSFAAIPCVSLVLLGHTNRSVSWSHESQREIALVYALSKPIPDYERGEARGKKGLCFAGFVCFGRFVGRWHRTIRIRVQIAAESWWRKNDSDQW